MSKLTNVHNLPQSVYEALAYDDYDHNDDPNTISVTELIMPPKIRALRKRHADEIVEDVSDNLWKLLGTAVHHVLADVSDTNRLVEERLSEKIGGWTISGKADIYHANGLLQDYKITSAWGMVFEPQGKREWHEQLNLYSWLIRGQGLPVESAEVVVILRDWQKSKAKADAKYPQIACVVVPIPLWDADRLGNYIGSRLVLHGAAQSAESDDDIPTCTPEERWEKDTVWALMKDGRKSAVKLFDSSEKATAAMPDDGKHRVDERKGVDVRCDGYCSVRQFCNFGRELE